MDKIETFWKWFSDHQKEILDLKDAAVEMQILHLNWLNLHLKHYCDALDIVIILPTAKSKDAELRIYSNFFKDNLRFAFELVNAAPKTPKWDIVLAFTTPKALRKHINSLAVLTIIPDVELKNSVPASNGSLKKFDKPLLAMLETKAKTYFWYSKNYLHEIPELLFNCCAETTTIPKFDIVMRIEDKHHGLPMLQFYDFDLFIDRLNRGTDQSFVER